MAAKTVYVEIVAQTKKFNAGLKKADAGLARLKKGALIASTAIAAIGGLAVREALQALDEFAGKADDLAKMAKATGVTAAAIQKLGFAMNLTGGDSNTLQKGIITLQDRIGQASQGSATYIRQLEAIGLNWKELVKLSPTEQLLAVTDALRQTADQNTRSAAGSLLLGRAYKQNAAFFAASREEIEGLLKEAGEIGIIEDDVLAAAEAFEDAKEKIELAKTALMAGIWREFGPQITEMRNRVIEWWKALGDEGRAKLISRIVTGLKVLAAVIGVALVVAIGAAAAILAPFALVGAKVALIISGITIVAFGLVGAFQEVVAAVKQAWEWFQKIGGITGIGGKILEFVGLGGDDSMAQSAGAPAAQSAIPAPSNMSTNVVNNYNISGMTAEQLEARARRNSGFDRRGKGR